MNKNKYLVKLLKQKCARMNLELTRSCSIVSNDGSVQHQMFRRLRRSFQNKYGDRSKMLIEHADDRQEYIDQHNQLICSFDKRRYKIFMGTLS